MTAGKGLRIAATLSRLSHPFPSKTGLCSQTFERRETAALLGFVGEAFHDPFESTGLFFDLWLGECLFVWGECAWSATARVIMQTLGAMVCPLLDPGRHGDTMDLRGSGNGLDGRACGTQQQTMGAAPRAECSILCHRFSKSARCSLVKGCTYLMIITSSGRGEYATKSGWTLMRYCINIVSKNF